MPNPKLPGSLPSSEAQFNGTYAILNLLMRDEEVVIYLDTNFRWKSQEAGQVGVGGSEERDVGDISDCLPRQ
jgi:hypothetical protein